MILAGNRHEIYLIHHLPKLASLSSLSDFFLLIDTNYSGKKDFTYNSPKKRNKDAKDFRLLLYKGWLKIKT